MKYHMARFGDDVIFFNEEIANEYKYRENERVEAGA
jgi:hypothetical protein